MAQVSTAGTVVAVFAFSFFSLIANPLAQPSAAPQPADTIVVNARIYTVNSQQPWAEALAIRGDKIVAVGSAGDISRYRGTGTQAIDARNHLILPGFTDSHIHLLDGGLRLQQLQLDDFKTLSEILARVKQYAAEHPEKAWIVGRGWSYPAFGPAAIPDKKYLDEVVRDRPIYLEAFDGHTWWANSKALQLAGITSKTPDPAGGYFVRDPKTGEPTGAVKEDAASVLIDRVIPAPSREETLEALRAAVKAANRVGLVRVHGASDLRPTIDDLQNVAVFDQLRQSGELTLRLYLAYYLGPPVVTSRQVSEIEALQRRYHDDWISAGAAKFFLDGVIETHTAAMLLPYADEPGQSGQLLWDPATFKQAVTELDRHGIQIFTHAIGDRAVRLVLDAYQEAQQINHSSDSRHRIEHIETIAASDIPRFGKLGVIASFQPLHAYPEEDTLKVWARNVGPERTQRAWAWGSVAETGGQLAFGSDWPVVTLNPWLGLQNALTRQTTEGEPPGGFVPRQRISLQSAINAYTLGAAFAGHREKTEGSLEPGKLADLIILSQDLFKIEPSDIGKTEVLLTMVGGKVVYQSPAWVAAHPASPKAGEARP